MHFCGQATFAKHSPRGRRSQFAAYIFHASPSFSFLRLILNTQLRLLPPRGCFAIPQGNASRSPAFRGLAMTVPFSHTLFFNLDLYNFLLNYSVIFIKNLLYYPPSSIWVASVFLFRPTRSQFAKALTKKPAVFGGLCFHQFLDQRE
ncbi:hypothetical protein DFR64_2350 [Pelolinea submarina]|uniref:Uncharacterized protein n=1 Tax=Pelolinea submarina TaxID=913107 RepID=A0A3E0A8A5_9CHLR|nr:hypothetical protein DFR64_2350 [Pelolinea submarina]